MGVRERYEQRQKEGKSSDYSGVKQRYMAKEIENVGSSITNRVNTWLKNHNTYISNYQTRNSGRKYNYEDSYVSDSADWLNTVSQQKSAFDAEADSILSYMDQYKDYLDADWMSSVRKTLTEARSAQDIVLGNTKKDNEWWSSFGSEEMLKAHGSAEEAYKYYQWDDGLKTKYTGATGDDILKALDTLGVSDERDWLKLNQGKIFGDTIRGDTAFQDYATIGSGLSYTDFGTETRHRGTSRRQRSTTSIDKYRAASLALAEHYGNEAPLGTYGQYDAQVAIFRTMDDKEFENLAYCIAYDKENGTNTAEQYVNLMEETLSNIRGTDIGEKITGIDIPVIEDLAVLGYGALAGVDNFAFGIEQFMSDDEVAYYPSYYANAHIADSLDGLGYYAHSAATNIGNMAPSILVSGVASGLGVPSKVSEALGSATMGVSAAGGAYKEALAKGYDKESARTYSNLVGASEGLLQYLIGGVGKLGGVSNIFSKLAGKISLIDNALLRGAAKYGMSIGSEIFEEEIQNFLEPAFRSIIFGEGYDAPTINEMIETAIVTALSTGVLEGGSTYTGIKEDIALDKQAAKDYGDKTDALIQEGLQNDVKSASNKLAQKYQKQTQGKDGKGGKAMTGSQIRNLLAANQAEVTKADLGKIQDAAANRLAQVGQREDIYKIAELATKYATGQEMTRAERSTLARSNYGSQVASEMLNGIHPDKLLSNWENNMSEESGAEYSTDWTGEIDTESDQFIRFNNKKLARAIFEHLANSVVEDPAAYKSLESRVEAEEPAQVSDTGKSVIHGTDQEIDLTKPTFKEITKKGAVLEADGKLVSANNIDYADENLGYAIRSVGKIENITPEAAGAVVSLVDMSKPVVAQMNAMDEAFSYGYNNYSVEDLKAGLFTKNLTDAQLNDAYKLGQYVRGKTVVDADAPVVKMRTALDAKLTAEQKTAQQKARIESDDVEVYFEDGGTVVKFDDHTGKYDPKRMAAVNTAKFLSKLKIGGKYYFYESYENAAGERVYKDANGNEVAAPNGMYKDADGSIHIDLNAGNDGQGTALFTLGHELTHFVKDQSKKQFKILGDLVKEAFDKTDMSMHKRVLEKQRFLESVRRDENGNKVAVSYEEAYEEVVADAMSTMLTDGSFHEKLMEIKVKDKGLFNTIKRFFEDMIAKFKKVYEELTPDQQDAQDIRELKDMFDKIQTAFAEALVEASDNFQATEQIGIEIDADTESVSQAVMNSERTWTESEYVQQREKAAQEIAKAIGVSEQKAKDYIDSVNSIAKMIAEDRSRLDYFSSPSRSSFVDNAEYGGSFDFSTLCKKRRLLTGTFTAIQKALPNTALTADEILDIRNRMKEKGLEVSCGLCYVEGSRANMGQFAKEFLRLYKQYYPDAWQPNMADVNTPDGIEWVRINHPECYEQYEYFWNHYGTLKPGDKNLFASQQKPKLYQLHTEYKGEILNKFKNDDKVEDKNLNGGIRLQSFSDFEIVHLIDTMQIIMDMSRVGLAGQAYTKVPDFAWALGDTGLKINLSLIAKGVDVNGKLIFDDVEGMPIAEAMKLRDRYSKNVGTILVAFNDEQLLAAMADDRVDFIIPFHRSQWKKSQYEAMGLPAKTKDYTFMQNEKYIKPQFHEYRGRMVKDKATNYMPNEYWDFSKSGKENAEAYLEMCARNNKRPKFYKLLQNNGDGSYSLKPDGSTDGYWKLLIDFKMYDNDGNGSPQMPVKPDFNMEEATRMLNDYNGGHSNFPVAQGIVDSFVKEYKASHKGQKLSERYSPEVLFAKDPLVVATFPVRDIPTKRKKVNLPEIVKEAKKGTGTLVTAGQEGIIYKQNYVYISDIDRNVLINTRGINHGITGNITNSSTMSTAEVERVLPAVLRNSIAVNELSPREEDRDKGIVKSYVLFGYARRLDGQEYLVRSTVNHFDHNKSIVDAVEIYDVLKGLKAKKMDSEVIGSHTGNPAARPLNTTKSNYTISVKDLLGIVKDNYPEYLPDAFRSYYGVTDPKEKGLIYSERGEGTSNRHLLANAFEGLSRSSAEYKMIQDYKEQIKVLNLLDEQLSDLNAEIREIRFTKGKYDAEKLKKIEEKAERIARDIDKQDKVLIRMEASEPLRKIIAFERKKAAQKAKDHVNEIQQNKKVRAEQTELRHKIRKTIRDLDKILNRGNKKLNVKEDMKGFVSKALELADYLFTDHISNDDLIRKGITVRMTPKEAALVHETEDILSKIYDNPDSITDEEFAMLDAKRKANEEKLRDLLKAQRNERLNTPVYQLFNDLVTEYASLKNSNQEAVKASYNAEVERFLRSYIGESSGETDSDRKTLLQNMRVADMTTDELWKLYNAYTMVLTTVRDANKFRVKGMTETIDQMAGRVANDFNSRKIPDKKLAIAAQKLVNKFGWDYEKLYYALDRIGSEAFTELIMNIADSENTVMQDVMEAVAFRDGKVEKYGYNNWAVNKEIDREFLDNTGKKFKLTLGQLMALYAYSRREGAWDHLEYGGFMFGEAALTNPRPADTYKINQEQCEAITSLLTKEQKGYVEDMQKFLSETMGAKGNEVSMLLYGIKMFGEKNYFPIHVAGQFKAQANESQAKKAAGFESMTNAGFTHAQNRNAKAPIVLEGFNEIWTDHVNEMSRYHGTVPALEDLRRVMNRSAYSDSVAESQSIKQLMENSYGKEAREYFDNLYREANSGAITDKLQKNSKKLLSLFRKNSVAYSLSVLIQQPASLVRAYAMIDKKYFGFKGFGAITSGVAKAVSSKWNPAYANAYNEMLQYAPGVTMAKEIGGFDTATGGSIRSYLLDTNKSLKQKWNTGTALEKGNAVLDLVDNNSIANLPNVADKIAWIEIWNACKRETVATHKELVPNSEAFMQAVGERFTEVIRATQVYDSIFAKSPMLKSKNLAVQYLVSFANEPNTVANMVEKAVRDVARGDWKQGARTAAVVVYSIVFTNALKSFAYALRDDDEEETYIEKYIGAMVGNMMSDFNPLSYIPIGRDVLSLMQGYDVERPDMAIISDAIDAYRKALNIKNADTENMTEAQLIELDKKATEANWKIAESVASLFGIPLKNVRRDVMGVFDTARIASANAGKTTALSIGDTIYDAIVESIPFMSGNKSKQDKLYNAIVSGDKAYLARLKSTYKTDSAYQSAVRKALRENDSRIHEAAQAKYEGRTEEYKRIFREIQKEGKFSFDDIMSAVNSEKSAIRNKLEPDKATSSYTASDFVESIVLGDSKSAEAMKEDIIATKVANGKTQAEAEKEFISSVATGIRDAYSSGLLDEAGAEKMLMEYADKDEEEAASKVGYWGFCEDNPKYDYFTESNVKDYREFAEPENISLEVYAQFINGTKGLADIKDKWGDVEVTKREQVLEVIDSLPLTWQQKDALYLAAGYSESKIWDVPW